MTAGAAVSVVLEDLHRAYRDVRALDGLTLEIRPGELVALLGPSGCGKTTALRVLAGLEDLDRGRVLVGGQDVTGLRANRRDMGMVFQSYSLFPHLTAVENVAFGLRLRGHRGGDRDRRAREVLDLVGLSSQAERYAHQLSGGQQQRVALARALAIDPQVLLLDEPLSALDAKVRAQLREEIRRIQLEVGTTTVFVTHDQEEALSVADRVGVMRSGRLEQLAAPEQVYGRPATPFVAGFVGLSNRVPARAAGGAAEALGTVVPLLPGSPADGEVDVLLRPETLAVHLRDGAGPPGPPGPPGPGRPAVLVSGSFLGAMGRVRLRTEDGVELVAQVASDLVAAVRPGDAVVVSALPTPALAVERGRSLDA